VIISASHECQSDEKGERVEFPFWPMLDEVAHQACAGVDVPFRLGRRGGVGMGVANNPARFISTEPVNISEAFAKIGVLVVEEHRFIETVDLLERGGTEHETGAGGPVDILTDRVGDLAVFPFGARSESAGEE